LPLRRHHFALTLDPPPTENSIQTSNIHISNMEPKKKSGKKKRHISKHVLKAREGKAEEGARTEETIVDQQIPAEATPKVVGKKQKKHIKNPSEAAEYLAKWEKRESESWKFNKNTQSWLIRHMYEVEKVSKGTFKILLEYLNGLKGDIMRSRIRAEASRRARRYKEHVKKSAVDEPAEEDKDSKKSNDAVPEGDDSKKNDKSVVSKQEMLEEELRWNALDENDKRKEYKRARIILEAFKD